ncbi:MAG: dihydrofolate reductase [Bacteroidales bacterium]|nr:dihydrofolate reductase [Bacteroidales bacterium]
MKKSIIVAISDNNVIGKDNALLWRLSADMRFFKEKTTGHHIIMGRKTFESLGNRLLPNRTSIVISRNADYQLPEGGILATSIENAIAKVKDETEAFFIGGEQIYKSALPFVDTLYITRVHHTFDGDAFFPEIDKSQWKLVSSEHHKADEKNEYDYTFETYQRINTNL